MQVYRLEVLALAAALAAAGAAQGGCSPSNTSSGSSGAPSTSEAGGAGTTATTSSAAQGSGGASSTGVSGSSTGASSSSGGAKVYGYCSKPCAAPADCCPPNTPGCPSAQYPNNYTCVSGGCVNPACHSTSDCTATDPKTDCLTVSGVSDCEVPCVADGDCKAPQTCVGKDDSGKKFCLAKGSGCTEAMCMTLGLGTCVDGVCSCKADADCTRAGITKCVK